LETLNPNANLRNCRVGLMRYMPLLPARRIAAEVPGGLNIGTPLNPALFRWETSKQGRTPVGLDLVTLARAETAVAVPENLGTVADVGETTSPSIKPNLRPLSTMAASMPMSR